MYPLGARGSVSGPLGASPVSLASSWWLAGGISAANCIAAYAPKGAASLAASYSNLANPGTYDAAPGVAPTWASATGWTFNGLTQWLTTGIDPAGTNKGYSIIVKYSSITNASGAICGMYHNDTDSLLLFYSVTNRLIIYSSGKYDGANGSLTPSGGTLSIASNRAYYNGAYIGTISAGNNLVSLSIDIGATNGTRLYKGLITSQAIYNTAISDAQVAAVHAAMP